MTTCVEPYVIGVSHVRMLGACFFGVPYGEGRQAGKVSVM